MEGRRKALTRRVLIADDEFLIRWSLKQALSQEGYEVFAVEDGQKAIETGRATHFDFVITDLFMPEANGWDVLNFFSRSQPLSRVIIITGHGESDTERIAREKGAWACVEKLGMIDKIKVMLNNVQPA